MHVTHVHILAAAASSAALIAFLNSPPAQKDMMSYLGFMENGIFTLANNLRNNVGAMVNNKPMQTISTPTASTPIVVDHNSNATSNNNIKKKSTAFFTNK